MNTIAIPTTTAPLDTEVTIPGSKSLTNRALLVAALANGESVLRNALFSDDTQIFAESLRRLGIPVENRPESYEFVVSGQGGRVPAQEANLFVGNAGTAARFITALLSLGHGTFHMDGIAAMRVRPMSELLDVLTAQGARVTFGGENGYMPYTVYADGFTGGVIPIRANRTSQQLTALLMIAPYARQEMTIELLGELVSQPYIEMTLRLMRDWGVTVELVNGNRYLVRRGQMYQPQPAYTIEPDASSASYFFAAAAVTGGRVRVLNLGKESSQGDAAFVDLLAQMGCTVRKNADAIEVIGTPTLHGIDADMNAISDTVPTLAAIAPYADSPVTIRNVAHIRHKETDRIHAVVTELRRLGAEVDEFEDGLKIYPAQLRPAHIETYDDHRIAMSFAVTGLRTPGVVITNPECTSKTFPTFFEQFLGMFR